MKRNHRIFALLALMTVGTVGGLALWSHAQEAARGNPERRVAYYQDSMHPWVKSDRPGKCTICAMDLTPIYAGEQGFAGTGDVVMLKSNTIKVLNVETEKVVRGPLERVLRVAGVLEADGTRKTIIAAPAPGRIDNVAVASAGVEVTRGQKLATFYSPDLTFQTRRYIFRDRMTEHANQSALGSAMGGSSRHAPNSAAAPRNQPLNSQEQAGADPYFNDLLSTLSGTVVERSVFDGQYVAEGDRLFTIVDCSVLWFRFDVYEHQLPWLEVGQEIEITVPSIPGKVFPATVAVIEPTLNEVTRTIKVRADVSNPLTGNPERPQRALRLGMYAAGRLHARVPDVLTVRSEVVLLPGGQAYAYVDKGGGGYEQRPIRVGRRGDSVWEILEGLTEGERVVTSGNVLIDAQAQFVQGGSGPRSAMQESDPRGSAGPVGLAGGAMLPSAVAVRAAEAEPTANGGLSSTQHRALLQVLEVADGIGAALAADSIERCKPHFAALPAAVAGLSREFGGDEVWQALIERVGRAATRPGPADLAAARRWFLPLSTSLVGLVEKLRSEEARFNGLRVYHCPMAPKPGLWFQRQGPLQNPFFGSEMLTCGEEVRPAAAATMAAHTRAAKAAPVAAQPHLPAPAPALQPPAAQPLAAGRTAVAEGAPSAENDHQESEAAEAELRADSRAAQPPAEPRHGASSYGKAAANLQGRIGETPAANAEKTPEVAPAAVASDATGTDPNIAGFVRIVDGMSQALASDDLQEFQKHYADLSGVLRALEQTFQGPPRTNSMIRRLSVLSGATPAQDLAAVRKRFVLFSMNAVQLAKQLQTQGGIPAGFKVYRCSKTPGIWLQAKGQMRNPYLGSEDPACGEEVSL